MIAVIDMPGALRLYICHKGDIRHFHRCASRHPFAAVWYLGMQGPLHIIKELIITNATEKVTLLSPLSEHEQSSVVQLLAVGEAGGASV